MTAEADMWAAAVEQAFRAGCVSLVPSNKLDMAGATPSEAANEWRFLTAVKGGWADSRIRICNMCGIDPEIVRQEALRRGASRQAVLGLRHEMRREETKGQPRSNVRKPSAATIERNARIAADYCAGMPLPEMVEKYGLARTTIESIAQHTGARRPPRDNAAREQLCAAVCADWADGVQSKVIAQRHGITIHAAQKIAMEAGVKRPDWFQTENGRRTSEKIRARNAARNADRNAEIMRRHAAGESFGAIGRAMGINWTTARMVIRTASAVEVRGDSNSRAGGGGVASSVSFHVENMPEMSR
jgi:hypothetical protein